MKRNYLGSKDGMNERRNIYGNNRCLILTQKKFIKDKTEHVRNIYTERKNGVILT